MRSLTSRPGRRVLPKSVQFVLLALLIICASVSQYHPQIARAQSRHDGANVVAWQTLQSARHVPTTYKGRSDTVAKLQSGAAKPLAMASADLDGDGIADLVIGFGHGSGGILALHRGNLDAFAPQSHASWQAIAHEHFPPAFLPQASVIAVPEAPDFVVTGDFNGNGEVDLLSGARGSNRLYLLSAAGKGNFSKPQAIVLPGVLTSLAAAEVGIRDGKTDVVAGVQTTNSAAVLVYKGSAGGLNNAAVAYPLPQAATQLEIADLHGDGFSDIAVLAGSEVLIVHPTASAGANTFSLVERVPVAGAKSITVGSFILDRDGSNQLAVLSHSGIVQVLSPHELDTRQFTPEERLARRSLVSRGQAATSLKAQWAGESEAWNVVKSFSVAASLTGDVHLMAASLAHARPQDLVIVDSSDSRLHVLPANTSGDSADEPGELTVETGDAPVSVLAVRVNNDARPGLVILGKSAAMPKTMAPLPDPTFTVNRLDDPAVSTALAVTYCNSVPGDCSLREAVLRANFDGLSDTINIPAGTITLTQIGLKENSGVTGDIDVRATVSIVGSVDGSGNPTSIVQGCGGTSGITCSTGVGTNWNDKFISTNKDGSTNGSLSISNVIFRNGNNTNTNSPPDPAFNFLGGAVDFYGCAPEGGGCTGSLPVASLTITNVRFLNNTDAGCSGLECGGGLDAEFGPVTINSSVFSDNTAAGRGGALNLAGAKETMTINNTSFINAGAGNHSGSDGGAVYIDFVNSAAAGNISFHRTIVTGNTAAANGGGIFVNLGNGGANGNLSTATIDQSSTISGNSASSGGGVVFTGVSSPNASSLSISKTTITGNAATNSGGGIHLTGGGTLNLQYSRIVNNTAGSGHPTGVSIADGTFGGASTVHANDNWWGCNSGPAAAPCDTLAIEGSGTSTETHSPWIILTHTASPNTILFGGTSTLTADFLHEFNGSSASSIALSNIDVLLGLPITIDAAVKGTVTAAQTAIQNTGTATATFTANACGNGSATADVDNVDTALTSPAGESVIAHITIQCPDLMASKTNSISQSVANATTVLTIAGASWNWNINVQNAGAQATAAADFTSGQTILTDTLPGTNITYGTPTGAPANVNCSITSNVLTCTASAAFTIPIAGGFTVTIPATATVVGTYTNNGATCAVDPNDVIHENDETNNNCNSNSVTVTAPDLTATKTNNVSGSVPLSPGTWNWTVAVANSNAVTSSPATFADGQTILSDKLPATNITYGTPTKGGSFINITNFGFISCGITVNVLTCSASGGAVTIGGPPTGGSFQVSFTATATAAGTYVNPTGGTCGVDPGNNVVESDEANNSCSDTVTVVAPPTISKAFSPTTIGVNGTSTVTFTLNNPNTSTALSGVAFSDTLVSGLVVATPNGAVNNCGGTLTATAGSSSISLSGGTIASNASCTISVDVKGTSSGAKNNTTGAITSTNGGTGTASNTATLTVASPPTISKAFGAASIPLNGATSLTLTISNPNSGLGLTGVGFTDNLPAGLVVSTPNGESKTCNGTLTDTAGSSTISLSGATLASSGSCTITVNVTGTTSGTKSNTTGAISSTETGAGATSNTASLTVVGPPTISKAFTPASIPLNGTTSLSFTITNANATALTGLAFSDNLPTGLQVATVPNASSTCGGTFTAPAGATTVSLSAGTVAASNMCAISVDVTGTTAGSKSNTTGAISSTEGGTGTTSNTATLRVVAPPSIAKAFNPSSIALNATTSLTFTITNPAANTVAETGVAFSDTLPTGLTVASSSATVCGGTLTTTNPTGIALAGASIAVNSQCQFSVIVTGAAAGQYTNTSSNVSSTNGGTGNTASAGLSVATPLTVTKAFGAATIPLNGSTSLTLTINNPNSSFGLTGVSVADTLPSGLVVASVPGLSNTCNGNVTGGTAGSNTFSLSGGTLAASSSCTVSLNVTGTSVGQKSNTTGAVSSNETGTGGTSNTAILDVEGPPSIAKVFSPSTIALNGTTSLMFTITNPAANPVALTGVGVSDTLPTGMTVASSSATVCGGTLTTTAPTGITLSGAGVSINSQCQFSVTVTGAVAGSYTNTSGNVTSTNGGTGNTASAGLTVVAPPSISKGFSPTSTSVGGTSTLTLTITNPNGTALSGVAVTDPFPAGLQVATVPGASNTCGGTFAPAAGDTTISLSGGTIAASTSCAVSVNVTPTTSGSKLNTTGNVSSTNGGTGSFASATLGAGDFTIAVSPTMESIPPGHMAVYTLTLASTTGFQGTINLTCTGGPPGSTCTVTPSSVTLVSGSETAKVTVNLAVPRGASKGTFTLTFTGTSGTLTHSTTAKLMVGK